MWPPITLVQEILNGMKRACLTIWEIYFYIYTSDPLRKIVRDPGHPPHSSPPHHGITLSPGVPPRIAGMPWDSPESWSATPTPHLWALHSSLGPRPRGVHAGLQKPRQKLHEVDAGTPIPPWGHREAMQSGHWPHPCCAAICDIIMV